MTIVFTVMGMMNIAHGELITVAAYAAFVTRGSLLLASIIALVAGVVAALLLERVAFRSVRGADLSAQLVTSLAVSVIIQNVIVLVVGARPKSLAGPRWLSKAITVGNVHVPALQVVHRLTGPSGASDDPV